MLLSQPMVHIKLKVCSKREHITPASQGAVCCCFVCVHTNSHTGKSPSLGLLEDITLFHYVGLLCLGGLFFFFFFFLIQNIYCEGEKKYKENRCDLKVLGFTKTKLHIGRVFQW